MLQQAPTAQPKDGRSVAPAVAPRMQRWHIGPFPFAVTLATSVGLLVLLAVAAVLAIQWRASERNTLELLNEKATLIAERLQDELSDHLQPAADLADFLAAQIQSGAVDPSDEARLNDLFTGALAATPQVAGVVFIDTALEEFVVHRLPGNQRTAIERKNEADNPAVRAAIEQIRDTRKAFWGEPVHSGVGQTLVNLRRPLHREDVFLGVLVVVISVPQLSEIVTHTGDLFDATAFVLYGNNRVLAHPNLVADRAAASAAQPLVPLTDAGDLVLASIWEGTAIPGFEEAAASNVNVVELDIGSLDYVIIYKLLRDYGATPWVIGAWFPADQVGAEFRRLVLAGLAGVGVLLLGIIAAIFLGRFVARPIIRVAASAAKVSELDLAHVEPLPSSAIRELNEQARAFNTMLSGLRSFETYVPRSLVTRLIHREGDHAVESEERELTVLFTDIAGFTAMCEGMPAGRVARFLNVHFALLGRCVEEEGGTVDKFIGDALMAFWGAPEARQDTAAPACRAALAMARAIEADNKAREARGRRPTRLRIGIHTGRVVVGNIGWPGRINYTIVGDTVNTCQRLEGIGKEMPGSGSVTILISGETAQRLGPDFRTEQAGQVEVRGRREPVEVYRLLE